MTHQDMENAVVSEATPGDCTEAVETERADVSRKELMKQKKRDYQRRYRERRIASGMCMNCGKNPVTSSRYCIECMVRKRERMRLVRGCRKRYYSLSYRMLEGTGAGANVVNQQGGLSGDGGQA